MKLFLVASFVFVGAFSQAKAAECTIGQIRNEVAMDHGTADFKKEEMLTIHDNVRDAVMTVRWNEKNQVYQMTLKAEGMVTSTVVSGNAKFGSLYLETWYSNYTANCHFN